MLWVIRWTDFRTFKEHAMVVEADSREAAEEIARKRRVTPTFIGRADETDVQAARTERRLWRYEAEDSLACFGRPVGGLQIACLIALGVSTIGVLLQVTGLLANVKISL